MAARKHKKFNTTTFLIITIVSVMCQSNSLWLISVPDL